MYHGILVDDAFEDNSYPERYTVFAKRTDDDWVIYAIEVEADVIDQVIGDIQVQMRSDKPFYAHFYNDDELIVVFKEKVFHVTQMPSTWEEIIKYGKTLGIPPTQLDFVPNTFEDEEKYFGE